LADCGGREGKSLTVYLSEVKWKRGGKKCDGTVEGRGAKKSPGNEIVMRRGGGDASQMKPTCTPKKKKSAAENRGDNCQKRVSARSERVRGERKEIFQQRQVKKGMWGSHSTVGKEGKVNPFPVERGQKRV